MNNPCDAAISTWIRCASSGAGTKRPATWSSSRKRPRWRRRRRTAGRRCGWSWPRASTSAASSSTPAAAAARRSWARPEGALLFYWHPLGRQVRIEGRIERVSDQESEEYFDAAPRRPDCCLGLGSERGDRVARGARGKGRRARGEFEGRDVPLPPQLGAATGWSRTSGSSGSTATAASTIALPPRR